MMNENTIYAEAGCSLIKLCRFALEHNLTGLEFAYGIPGTVGGAIYMNAGAYDGEIKNVITSANSVRADGTVHTIEANKMALAYRSSCYQKNGEVITSGVFRLEAGAYDDIQDKWWSLWADAVQNSHLNIQVQARPLKDLRDSLQESSLRIVV